MNQRCTLRVICLGTEADSTLVIGRSLGCWDDGGLACGRLVVRNSNRRLVTASQANLLQRVSCVNKHRSRLDVQAQGNISQTSEWQFKNTDTKGDLLFLAVSWCLICKNYTLTLGSCKSIHRWYREVVGIVFEFVRAAHWHGWKNPVDEGNKR